MAHGHQSWPRNLQGTGAPPAQGGQSLESRVPEDPGRESEPHLGGAVVVSALWQGDDVVGFGGVRSL